MIPRGFGCSFGNDLLDSIGRLVELLVTGVISLGDFVASDVGSFDDSFPFASDLIPISSFGGGFLCDVDGVVFPGDDLTSCYMRRK